MKDIGLRKWNQLGEIGIGNHEATLVKIDGLFTNRKSLIVTILVGNIIFSTSFSQDSKLIRNFDEDTKFILTIDKLSDSRKGDNGWILAMSKPFAKISQGKEKLLNIDILTMDKIIGLDIHNSIASMVVIRKMDNKLIILHDHRVWILDEKIKISSKISNGLKVGMNQRFLVNSVKILDSENILFLLGVNIINAVELISKYLPVVEQDSSSLISTNEPMEATRIVSQKQVIDKAKIEKYLGEVFYAKPEYAFYATSSVKYDNGISRFISAELNPKSGYNKKVLMKIPSSSDRWKLLLNMIGLDALNNDGRIRYMIQVKIEKKTIDGKVARIIHPSNIYQISNLLIASIDQLAVSEKGYYQTTNVEVLYRLENGNVMALVRDSLMEINASLNLLIGKKYSFNHNEMTYPALN